MRRHEPHRIVRHVRGIRATPKRVRGQKRRIRLGKNQLRACHTQRLLNILRVFEGHGSGEAHVPALLITDARQLNTARVAVKYSTLGGALLKEDAHHIIVGLPVVNLKRQSVFLRQANMLAKLRC